MVDCSCGWWFIRLDGGLFAWMVNARSADFESGLRVVTRESFSTGLLRERRVELKK